MSAFLQPREWQHTYLSCLSPSPWVCSNSCPLIQECHPTTSSSKSFNQFSCLVVSDSLRPHGLQHTRLPCPSPTPRACLNSCPSSWWCHPTISSSVSSSRILSCSLTWVPLHLNHTFYLQCSATCSGICLPPGTENSWRVETPLLLCRLSTLHRCWHASGTRSLLNRMEMTPNHRWKLQELFVSPFLNQYWFLLLIIILSFYFSASLLVMALFASSHYQCLNSQNASKLEGSL